MSNPSESRSLNRRGFLGRSAAAGALAMSALTAKRVHGANERLPVGLIGCGGRGSMVARNMLRHGIEAVWVCDVNPDKAMQAAAFLAEGQDGRKPKIAKDMQEVFDDPAVPAVIVATPDHWHAPAALRAVLAGKDVYVEKPHAHTVWESQQMIAAARKHDRIIQVGTQNRSAAYNQAAREVVAEGTLGDIHFVKTYGLEPGGPFRLGDCGTPPLGFDWDAWLGVAPERPYCRKLHEGGWHYFWDFSGGDLVDDGVHQIDLTMMALGDPGLPTAVSCAGGKLAYPDSDAEVPDVQVVTYEFDGFVMTFELTNYPRYMEKTTSTIRRNDLFPYWTQNATRIELYGTKLLMTIGRHGGGWQIARSGGKVYKEMYGRFPDDEHQINFVECVKAHKRPNADVEVAHNACVMCCLGNIAHRVGNQKLRFDPETQRFVDNDAANALLRRAYREAYAIPEIA